jgi:hypothetical protein
MAASPADSLGLGCGLEPPLRGGQLIHQQVYLPMVVPVRVINRLPAAPTTALVDFCKLHCVLRARVLDLHGAREKICRYALADIGFTAHLLLQGS